MICEKCGKNLPENLNYCPTCKTNEEQNINPNVANDNPIAENINNDVLAPTPITTIPNPSTMPVTPQVEIPPTNQNDINSATIEKTQEQASKIKKITKYILPIYIVNIVLHILIFNKLFNVTFQNVVFIIYGQLGIQIATIILSVVLTLKFIKRNFNKSEDPINFKVILNAIYTYFIYLVVSSIIFRFSTSSASYYWISIYIYILPMLLPIIIIPISHLLNKKNKINRKEVITITILLIVGKILEYIITMLRVSGYSSNILFGSEVLSLWQIIHIIHVPLVAIIPAFISSLIGTKPVETNN